MSYIRQIMFIKKINKLAQLSHDAARHFPEWKNLRRRNIGQFCDASRAFHNMEAAPDLARSFVRGGRRRFPYDRRRPGPGIA